MFQELSLSISSLVQWMLFVQAHSVNFSVQITLSLVKAVLVSKNYFKRAQRNKSRKQLGQRSLHWRCRTCWSSSWCRETWSRRLRLSSRFPNHSLTRWWYWCWHGYTFDLKNQRRIPRSNDGDILRCSITKSLRYSCRTIQRNTFSSSTCRKLWRDILYRQRGMQAFVLESNS